MEFLCLNYIKDFVKNLPRNFFGLKR